MTDLHDLCKFQRAIDESYVDELKHYLKSGIPATYTTEEAYNYLNNIDEEPVSTTTPLHLICKHIPKDVSKQDLLIVEKMVDLLFEYGAGWCLIDKDNDTPGCILIKRNLKHLSLYDQIVQAGIRAELLLRKVDEYDMEIIENDGFEEFELEGIKQKEGLTETSEENETKAEEEEEEEADAGADQKSRSVLENNISEAIESPTQVSSEDSPKHNSDQSTDSNDRYDAPDAPSHNQNTYLKTKLEYTDDSLITKDRKDGVMMSWETDLMQLGCDTLFEGSVVDQETQELDSEINILNIGFGMGIIDKMIQLKNPTKHYICEAHPDVLKKLKQDGWYEKRNVVILEGRWQDNLDFLLSSGVFFNGIYYDTFSENYQDMLELFDYIVGLLKPHGVFSFFNGLGADRQVIYEVYKQLVEIDLGNYGLKCSFKEIEVLDSTLNKGNKSVWDDVKRSYWSCPIYYHPTVKFIDFE